MMELRSFSENVKKQRMGIVSKIVVYHKQQKQRMCIQVSLSPHKLVWLVFFIVLIAMAPFAITSLYLFYTQLPTATQYDCMYDSIKLTYNSTTEQMQESEALSDNDTVSYWLEVDGFSRIAITTMSLILAIIGTIVAQKAMLSSIIDKIITLVFICFYAFHMAWIVHGMYLYMNFLDSFEEAETAFEAVDGNPTDTYECNHSLVAYFNVTCVLGVILDMGLMVISSLTPSQKIIDSIRSGEKENQEVHTEENRINDL